MTKSDLDGENYVAQYGEEAYVSLVSIYSIHVGIASLVLSLTGLGKLATKSIPKAVRSGFKWGTGIGVLCSAVPNGFLLKGNSTLNLIISDHESAAQLRVYLGFLRNTFPIAKGALTVTKTIYLLTSPHHWSLFPSAILFLCTACVMKGSQYLPKYLPPGSDVILVTAAATIFSLKTNYEGAVIGQIPVASNEQGSILPFEFDTSILSHTPIIVDRCFNGSILYLFFSAAVFSSINFLSIIGVASAFEAENNIPWSPTRELAAQGVANCVAGCTGSAPVGGSLSRSLVSRMTGATSSLSSIITALCWIWLLPYMSFMSSTPKSALSAVIISAVIKSILYPKDLLRMNNFIDKLSGWCTGIAICLTSPTVGFTFGIMLYNTLKIFFRK